MEQHHIRTGKTARYFQSGHLTPETRTVWFALHGYGQLAGKFIEKFRDIAGPRTAVIAPEGLHRFYLEGYHGRVGASWMTRADRENDIRDYIEFLDRVYSEVTSPLKKSPVKTVLFGFSQGVATAVRWLSKGSGQVDEAVFWGGVLPRDFEPERDTSAFENVRLWTVYGNRDEFRDEERIREQEKILDESGIEREHIEYAGTHRIDRETLKTLAKRIEAGNAH